MNISKKRHIQESNRILEERHFLNEGLFIDRKLPEDIVTKSLKLATVISSGSSEFNQLINDTSKNKFKKWANRKIIHKALAISDQWCKNKTQIPGMSETDVVSFPCIEINDYVTGDKDSMLTGYLGIFGNLTSNIPRS